MRLIEYKENLNIAKNSLLEFIGSDIRINGYNRIQLTNFKNPMKQVSQLNNMGFFTDITSHILGVYEYLLTLTEEKAIMEVSTFNSFNQQMRKLHSFVEILYKTIDEIVPNKNSMIISIKLPFDIESVEDFHVFVKEFEDSLKFFQKLNLTPKFKGFDVGSAWIDVLIESYDYLVFFFQVLSGLLFFAKLYLETEKSWEERISREKQKKVKKEQLEYLEKIKNDELAEYIEKEELVIKQAMQDTSLSFNTKEETNEFINIVRISIRRMTKLLNRGMQIVPANDAEKEIKELHNTIQESISAYQKIAIGVKEIKALGTEMEENNSET